METTTTTGPAPRITNQIIALTAICFACSMTFGAFCLSRNDHDLKLISLTAVLSLGSGLMGIAGTILVGVQAYKSLTTTDLPPGARLRESTASEVIGAPAAIPAAPAPAAAPIPPIPPTKPAAAQPARV